MLRQEMGESNTICVGFFANTKVEQQNKTWSSKSFEGERQFTCSVLNASPIAELLRHSELLMGNVLSGSIVAYPLIPNLSDLKGN